MLRPRLLQIYYLIVAAMAAHAQDQLSIGGSVVNSVTGEPIRNALVTLQGVPSMDQIRTGRANFDPGAMPRKTTFAGTAGEFEFTGLPKGSYQLSAQKPGFNLPFTGGSDRPPRLENLTSSVSGVQIKLAPLGSIEGKLVDQHGDPVIRANVALFSTTVSMGYRNIIMNRTVTTDDRGVFRVWDLTAGKYYIKATGKSGGTYMYVGDNSTRTDTWESFAPAYFGGGRELASATPISIGAGTEARADLSLTLEPAFKIRGTLADFTPHETVMFTLLQGGEEVSASRSTLNGTTGKFEIDDVIAGSYVLRAQQGQKTRGEAPVTVSGGDLNDVSITLSRPVTMQISERIIGPIPETPDDVDEPRSRSGAPSCNVGLRASDRQSQDAMLQGFAGHPASGTNQTIANLYAGEYRVDVSCFGGYPLSVTSGGTDLLTNPKITIQPGVAPPPIEINLKAGGGTLVGHFDVNPRPINIGALIVPTFSASTGPIFFTVGIGPEPFTYPGLAPGDYLVYAVVHPEEQEYREPGFFESLSGGVSVKIEDGKTSEITLTSVAK